MRDWDLKTGDAMGIGVFLSIWSTFALLSVVELCTGRTRWSDSVCLICQHSFHQALPFMLWYPVSQDFTNNMLTLFWTICVALPVAACPVGAFLLTKSIAIPITAYSTPLIMYLLLKCLLWWMRHQENLRQENQIPCIEQRDVVQEAEGCHAANSEKPGESLQMVDDTQRDGIVSSIYDI